jgi:hypothetical protein
MIATDKARSASRHGSASGIALLLLSAAVLAAIGLIIPVHFGAVNDSVLEAAVRQMPGSAADPARHAVDRAEVGPAQLFLASGFIEPRLRTVLEQRTETVLKRQPLYGISGGPEPFFESYLRMIGLDRDSTVVREGSNKPVHLLFPATNRESLRRFLSQSSVAFVDELLTARSLSGLTRLHPADSAAGAPFDTALLLTALLAQGDHLSPTLTSNLRTQLRRAKEDELRSINAIEDFAIGLLTISRRLDYLQTARLLKRLQTIEETRLAADRLRKADEQLPQLFTALMLSSDTGEVLRYMRDDSRFGEEDVIAAAAIGRAALDHLVASGKPRYRPPQWWQQLYSQLQPVVPAALAEWTFSRPTLALILKGLAFVLSALCAVQLLAILLRSRANGYQRLAGRDGFVLLRNGAVALVLASLFWIVTEPNLMREEVAPSAVELRFNLAFADSLQTLSSPFTLMENFDNITLLILALFFVIQFVIYLFCLIKLREVSRQNLSADLKLKLLENEENLFDFGLYVGLGGTVTALVLVVLGIVEASLMAAYASTLFGILFVALIKIVHVRPFRRSLILAANRG